MYVKFIGVVKKNHDEPNGNVVSSTNNHDNVHKAPCWTFSHKFRSIPRKRKLIYQNNV